MKRLETERCILRAWQLDDAEDMYAFAKNVKVGPCAGWQPHQSKEESYEIIKMFIELGEVYAIVDKASEKVIGSIGIHERYPDESQRALFQRELGFVLNPDYWGRGIMPEVVRCVLAYCFDDLGLDKVWVGHFDDNMRSKRVIEKLGFRYAFTKDGVAKALGNKPVRTLYYYLKRMDYAEMKAQY